MQNIRVQSHFKHSWPVPLLNTIGDSFVQNIRVQSHFKHSWPVPLCKTKTILNLFKHLWPVPLFKVMQPDAASGQNKTIHEPCLLFDNTRDTNTIKFNETLYEQSKAVQSHF